MKKITYACECRLTSLYEHSRNFLLSMRPNTKRTFHSANITSITISYNLYKSQTEKEEYISLMIKDVLSFFLKLNDK